MKEDHKNLIEHAEHIVITARKVCNGANVHDITSGIASVDREKMRLIQFIKEDNEDIEAIADLLKIFIKQLSTTVEKSLLT
jgi:hypothetical protein